RYVLLVGPPGQGKSALLAQFAYRKRDQGGCLFHMLGSNKNPRSFMQFLLWQGEQLLGEPLPEAKYQGEIDDLRNALVDMLARVRDKRGRALMVIDGLDELDESGRRLDFLPVNLPKGVDAVLASRPNAALVKSLGQRLAKLIVQEVPPLDAQDLRQFLAKN